MDGIKLGIETAGQQKEISVIKVGGYIDTTTSAELENALETLLQDKTYNIVIDLADVDYISSAGWGIFISEIKGIREAGGDLKLVGMISDVLEVFELLEFHFILKSFTTLEEAINDFEVARTSTGAVVDEEPHERVETAAAVEKKTAVAKGTDIREKIKMLVRQNPDFGSIKIVQTLKEPAMGNETVSWFQVRRLLKEMGLDTKKKRLDYSRS